MRSFLHGNGVLSLEAVVLEGRPIQLSGSVSHTYPEACTPTLTVVLCLSCSVGDGRRLAPKSPACVLLRLSC